MLFKMVIKNKDLLEPLETIIAECTGEKSLGTSHVDSLMSWVSDHADALLFAEAANLLVINQ